MSANDRQVAGDHYQTDGEQHWDRQWKLHGRGYFVGCITKYVERYHKKNGVQDLEKAKHFLEKLIELEKASTPKPVGLTQAPLNTSFNFYKETASPGRGYVNQD